MRAGLVVNHLPTAAASFIQEVNLVNPTAPWFPGDALTASLLYGEMQFDRIVHLYQLTHGLDLL
jgi:hypothetical protein